MSEFDGLGVHLGNLARLSKADTRSISSENPTGEKGGGGRAVEGTGAAAARDLGVGWKVSPSLDIAAGETLELARIAGSGAIQHVWLTLRGDWRRSILRAYWDGSAQPSIECPVGDFFGMCWGEYAPLASLAVCVNPGSGFNCYWEMPFRTEALLTLENVSSETARIYYQVDYALTDVPADAAYFHAQFRRVNPLAYGAVHTVLDGVHGRGHYVGTVVGWGSNSSGWWGEGEVKFFLDGDDDFPTICGTGTEDYFGGAYNFENVAAGAYEAFSTPYSGLHQVLRPDGLYRSQQRFAMYRWHLADPIRFQREIRVTLQALGWRSDRRYLPLQDDICSVAYWYQTLPAAPFPPLPGPDDLEVV